MDWREENKLKQKAQEYYKKEFSYNQVYIQGYSDGYAKGIDEFAEQIKVELQGEHWTQFCTMRTMIDKIAEQMKVGGTNANDR